MQGFEWMFFWLTECIYAIAFFGFLCSAIFKNSGFNKWIILLSISGLVTHTSFLIMRWVIGGHPPIVSLFELVCSGAWFAVLTLLLIYLIYKKDISIIGSVVLSIAFLTMGASFFVNPAISSMTPGLKSFWLYIHVFFALISYGCFVTACGGGVVYLIKAKKSLAVDNNSGLNFIELLNFKLIFIGFITTAVFISSGAVWAYYAWGRYWGWDPVETASLATWITYGLYLHLRLRKGWRGKRTAWLAIGTFVLVLLCFWLIPFLMPSTIHNYSNI